MSSLWNTRSRKTRSPLPLLPPLDLVDLIGGPGVHGRVQIAELPLVGGDLPVRVLVPLLDHQLELGLGLIDVDRGHRERVEGEVPRGEPGILPRVGHGDDVGDREVAPVRGCGPRRRAAGGGDARRRRARRRRRSCRTACVQNRPAEACRWMARRSSERFGALHRGVERVGLARGAARAARRCPSNGSRAARSGAEAHAAAARCRPRGPRAGATRRPWCRAARGSPRARRPRRRGRWNASFTYGVREARPEEALVVGLVVGEEQLRARPRRRRSSRRASLHGARRAPCAGARRPRAAAQRSDLGRLAAPLAPRPRVAEPEVREDVERRRVGPAVLDGDRPSGCRSARAWRTRR